MTNETPESNNLDTLDNVITTELHVDNQMADYLMTACRWAKFLSIVGFVFIGLICLGGLFATFALSEIAPMEGAGAMPFDASAFGLIYLLIGLLYLAPTLYLYRFATRTKNAVETMNQLDLQEGIRNLKSLFKFMGMLTAIIMGFYGIIIVFAIIGGGMAALFS